MARFECTRCGLQFSADLDAAMCPACGGRCIKLKRSLAFRVAAAIINSIWFILKLAAAAAILVFCGIAFLFAVLAGNRTLAGLILGGVAGYALAKVGLRGLEQAAKNVAKKVGGER